MDVDKKILITGSNGFVGKKLYERLNLEGYDLLGATRDTSKNILNQKNIFIKSIILQKEYCHPIMEFILSDI